VLTTLGVGGIGVVLVDGGTPRLRFTDLTLTGIQDFAFDWTDGEQHTYRILTDSVGDTVVLVIDDVVQAPVLALSAFTPVSDRVINFGVYCTSTIQSATVNWNSASYLLGPPVDAKRTLGVWLGGDETDIDNWEIPRTDSSDARNHEATGPVVVEMDWRSDMEVRLYRDPTWGVTVYRPDIPLPPYYQPETFPATPGVGFATQTTEPSAGWINVEYRNLPKNITTFGEIAFGALNHKAVTQQRWSQINYRIHRHPTEDYRAPQGMILNRYNTINSGELTKDVTPEQVVIQPVSDLQVSLLPTHLYADRIFKVIEENRPTFTPDMFSFDVKSQTITLLDDSNGEPRYFGVVLTGTAGAFAKGSKTFTDTSANFTTLLPGYTIHVTSGLAAGAYVVTAVTSPTTLTVATAFPYPSVGPVPWTATRTPQPVTVVFAPGRPVTNTYLSGQPLLDSVTLLNEGTPPYPKSQTAEINPIVIYGAPPGNYRNLSTDTPVDVQADPWRVLSYENVTGTYYEGMEFQEISDDGTTDLISMICEGQLPVGDSGFLPAGGDKIYSPTGTGPPLVGYGASANLFETGLTVGGPGGGFVLEYGPADSLPYPIGSVPPFYEQRVGTPQNALGGIPGPVVFIASGGGYVGPTINRVGGQIAVLEPINKPGQPGGSVEVILKDTTFFTVQRFIFNG